MEDCMRRACLTAECKEQSQKGKVFCDLLTLAKQKVSNIDTTTEKSIKLLIKGMEEDIPDFEGMQVIASNVIRKFPYLFQFLPKEAQTQNMCKDVIEQEPEMIEFVAPKYLTYDLCLQSVKKRWLSVAVIPMGMRTGEICQIAEAGNEMAKKFFPPSLLKS